MAGHTKSMATNQSNKRSRLGGCRRSAGVEAGVRLSVDVDRPSASDHKVSYIFIMLFCRSVLT